MDKEERPGSVHLTDCCMKKGTALFTSYLLNDYAAKGILISVTSPRYKDRLYLGQ